MGSSFRPLRVVTHSGRISDLLRAYLTEEVEFRIAPSLKDFDVVPLLADADVLISGRFTAGIVAQDAELRLVQTTGIGTDGVDFAALPPMTTVCNVTGHDIAVAEYVITVMLSLQRGLLGMDRRLRVGDWSDRNTAPPRPELNGRSLAIIGLGAIGVAVARLASALNMSVHAIVQNPDSGSAHNLGLEFLGGPADLHTVLASADTVVLAVPLTEHTKEMIGAEELRVMKPHAYLVNAARGGVVNEEALYEALRKRWIAGAAVDVWYQYPEGNARTMPSAYPFHELDNIIMTPHIAGWTENTMLNRMRQMDKNLRRLSAGEPLINVVSRPPASSAG